MTFYATLSGKHSRSTNFKESPIHSRFSLGSRSLFSFWSCCHCDAPLFFSISWCWTLHSSLVHLMFWKLFYSPFLVDTIQQVRYHACFISSLWTMASGIGWIPGDVKNILKKQLIFLGVNQNNLLMTAVW